MSCGLTTSVTGRRRRSQPQDIKLHPASFDFGDWATPRKDWQDFFCAHAEPAVKETAGSVHLFGQFVRDRNLIMNAEVWRLDALAAAGVAVHQGVEGAG